MARGFVSGRIGLLNVRLFPASRLELGGLAYANGALAYGTFRFAVDPFTFFFYRLLMIGFTKRSWFGV